MRELLLSIKDLVKGILRRFLLWVPFLLLDSSDYWERYLHPWLLQITGKNFMIPDGALLALMILGVAWAGILTFHELHERKAALDKKLEPTVEFSETAIIQQWTDQFTQKPCRAFYIAVKNSSATPLRGVSVLLTNIVPGVPNLDWLPIPLHIKHDNAVPNREVFNMNPMGLRHIDLVSHMETTSTFTVEHTVNGTNKDIPVGVYIFTVRVEGQNVTSPSEAKFLVRLDPAGKLVCLSAKYVDLDKGLFELRRDTKIGLENYLTPAIQKMTDVTDEISALMTSLTEELTEAQSKPIAIHEKVFFRTNSIADRLLRLSRGCDLPRLFHPVITEDFRIAANSFGVR